MRLSLSKGLLAVAVAALALLFLNGQGERLGTDTVQSAAASAAGTKTSGTKKESCALTQKPRELNAAPYYEGPLIDAHVHMPVSSSIVAAVGRRMGFEGMPAFGGSLTPEYLACLFKSEGITRVFGFFLTTRFSLAAEVRSAANFRKKYGDLIVPFYMPGTNDTLRVATSTAARTLTANPELFLGIGEIKMFDRGSLLRPVFLSHYDLAQKHGLVLMIHPYPERKAEVLELLRRYPEVKFIFHGGHDSEWIVEEFSKYKNAYYSLDADMVGLYSSGPNANQKHPSKAEFLARFKSRARDLLTQALAEWQPRIEAHPDRFLWGTDRWFDWHFDYEVGGLLEEFGRAFIGRLPPEVQGKVAYRNAEALLAAAQR